MRAPAPNVTPEPEPPGSWREVARPPARRRALSPAAKRRRAWRVFKAVFYAGVLVGTIVGARAFHRAWRENPGLFRSEAAAAPLRTVEFSTDGVLDRAWAEETLGLAPGTPLADVDVAAAARKLEAGGQARAAVVSRKFPDTLVVRIGERLPVARLMARVGDGPAEALLAARDGVLYKGRGYPPGLEAGLPWLDGVRLSRAGAGFAPIEGMETVSDLLEQARTDAPELYRDIRVVSLERLAEDGVLLARMGAAERVRFGTREGFPAQIRRLEWTLGRLRAENPGARVRSVDLSIGATQVPVTLDEAPAARGARTARGRIFQP